MARPIVVNVSYVLGCFSGKSFHRGIPMVGWHLKSRETPSFWSRRDNS